MKRSTVDNVDPVSGPLNILWLPYDTLCIIFQFVDHPHILILVSQLWYNISKKFILPTNDSVKNQRHLSIMDSNLRIENYQFIEWYMFTFKLVIDEQFFKMILKKGPLELIKKVIKADFIPRYLKEEDSYQQICQNLHPDVVPFFLQSELALPSSYKLATHTLKRENPEPLLSLYKNSKIILPSQLIYIAISESSIVGLIWALKNNYGFTAIEDSYELIIFALKMETRLFMLKLLVAVTGVFSRTWFLKFRLEKHKFSSKSLKWILDFKDINTCITEIVTQVPELKTIFDQRNSSRITDSQTCMPSDYCKIFGAKDGDRHQFKSDCKLPSSTEAPKLQFSDLTWLVYQKRFNILFKLIPFIQTRDQTCNIFFVRLYSILGDHFNSSNDHHYEQHTLISNRTIRKIVKKIVELNPGYTPSIYTSLSKQNVRECGCGYTHKSHKFNRLVLLLVEFGFRMTNSFCLNLIKTILKEQQKAIENGKSHKWCDNLLKKILSMSSVPDDQGDFLFYLKD